MHPLVLYIQNLMTPSSGGGGGGGTGGVSGSVVGGRRFRLGIWRRRVFSRL